MKRNLDRWWYPGIRWWLSGLIDFSHQLVNKPFRRYKYPGEAPESISERRYRGLWYLGSGSLWVLVVPLGCYLTKIYALQGATMIGLGFAGYLYVTGRAQLAPALVGGFLGAYMVLQASTHIMVPLTIIFAVKGGLEILYGMFETLIGMNETTHHWMTNYRGYLTQHLGYQYLEESPSIQYATQRLLILARDEQSIQANQLRICQQLETIQHKVRRRLAKHQATRVNVDQAQQLHAKLKPSLQQQPNSVCQMMRLLGVKLPTLNPLTVSNWKKIQANIHTYGKLFTEAKAECDAELVATKLEFKRGHGVTVMGG